MSTPKFSIGDKVMVLNVFEGTIKDINIQSQSYPIEFEYTLEFKKETWLNDDSIPEEVITKL